MDAPLATPGLDSKEDLARHIEAMSAAAFIRQAAHAKKLDAETTGVYQAMEDKVVIVIKDLPGALTLKDLAPILSICVSISFE